ncbi:NAD(P)/FAD-dependent oxidoreductase [Achromobacter deleyi]|uniref:NAD(P)/FAD-dependent oxidoreductase n=1 Tax=Achromobacter deleyi TaxID=1353891 RepID=UPI001E3FE78F|nr:NAD(P)/FAD-dependent oxidoreductase [Achromobacter deleyi]
MLEVAVVGAGPAGIGMAVALRRHGVNRLAVIDRHQVGASFLSWPQETRFITPSFYSNPFGLADLNAVTETSSPALTAGMEHLDGPRYAQYLARVAQAHDLPLALDCEVSALTRGARGEFQLQTSRGAALARAVIWATGEYQYPDLRPFVGAADCLHYAQVDSWSAFEAGEYLVIGGYESGVDAAVNLVARGARVQLLARKSTWDPASAHDPSLSLSPYSRQRLYQALDSGRLEIAFGVNVLEVRRLAAGFSVHAEDGRVFATANAPILGTGFLRGGGAQLIRPCFDWTPDGRPVLSAHDESTLMPGLFLAGPQVRQDRRIYCFIYKFRQRFDSVARMVAQHLGLPPLEAERAAGAWGPFGNADCCDEACEC